MRTQLDGMQVCADALAEVFGSGEFTERVKRRQATIAAVDAGFLRVQQASAGARVPVRRHSAGLGAVVGMSQFQSLLRCPDGGG